jgi:hypothetical protein
VDINFVIFVEKIGKKILADMEAIYLLYLGLLHLNVKL